ncbi:hypothetical protein Q5P01_012770 [Channa striata]|uniref:Fork-head domain-containing protein n=1 Tax=Channa striata TaxID=64152 RepID=A0AA88MQD1_CHASR|nr:hypothetical protein Q5P01_012770 [Channa striata]
MGNANMEEDKARCDFRNGSDTGSSRKTTVADTVSSHESVHTKPTQLPDNRTSSSTNTSEDTQHVQKSSLSYIALISKVILSSPLQKLNLSSIYRAMEEQFPYLRCRGPGWRNSVRHNLSVNDCFVKVNRCEDGRGHYWGVHRDHLRDFQQGNFRLYRKSRERRVRARYDKVANCPVCVESRCLPRQLFESRSLGRMEPEYNLLELQSWKKARQPTPGL